MPSAQIDDAPAAEEASHAARNLPGLVELFARQAACATRGAGKPIEQRAAGEAVEIAVSQPASR